jgi:hypothetical protein
MKKILVTLTAGLLACSAFGQGSVLFATRGGGVDARVRDSLTGLFADGTAYSAQLYYSAPGAGEGSMQPVVTTSGGSTVGNAVTFGTGGTLGGYIVSGLGGAGIRYVSDPARFGAPTDFQVRAWQASLGSTWEIALNNWSGSTVLGKSAIVTVTTSASAIQTAPPLTGLAAFTLDPVPEPSVIALGAIGLVGLLWRRRK